MAGRKYKHIYIFHGGRRNTDMMPALLTMMPEILESQSYKKKSLVIPNLAIKTFTPEMRNKHGFHLWWSQVQRVFDHNGFDKAQAVENLLYYTKAPLAGVLAKASGQA